MATDNPGDRNPLEVTPPRTLGCEYFAMASATGVIQLRSDPARWVDASLAFGNVSRPWLGVPFGPWFSQAAGQSAAPREVSSCWRHGRWACSDGYAARRAGGPLAALMASASGCCSGGCTSAGGRVVVRCRGVRSKRSEPNCPEQRPGKRAFES